MKWNQQKVAEFLASIGAALLIAAYLRYSIQGELLLFSKILLIAGGVLLLGGIVLGFGRIVGFFSKRSSQLGTNTAILTLAVLAILCVLNFLGFRHHKRFDLTSEKLYTLSDQTRKIVGGLKTDVTIFRFSKTPDTALDDLMTEYKNLSPHLKFQNVDPQEKLEVAKEYGATHVGDVVVASGLHREHVEQGSEEEITGAILKATREKAKMVCFVTGHGEKSVSDDGAEGYKQAEEGLRKEGFAVDSANLVTDNGILPDCNVLVIAGPKQTLFPQEAAMISKFLDGGGKALIEIDPITDQKQTEPKLDDVFQSWNIKVGDNLVIDASGIGQLLGAGPAIPLVVDYGASPITKGFERSMTFFPLARTVSIADKSKSDPEVVELLKTSPRSFTKAKIEKKVSYDPKTDTMGPLSLGVAAERKSGDKDSRLVVIGDSDFASNEFIGQQRNGDLFFNSIDWLAQDENLISIRPKSATNRRVTMTKSQASALFWLDQIFLPGIVIFSGIYIWWKRR